MISCNHVYGYDCVTIWTRGGIYAKGENIGNRVKLLDE